MQDSILESLEPKLVWQRFRELKNTPRPSKHEHEAMQYLGRWARANGFETHSDSVGNLCVQVPASADCENVAPVVLQNHVDIVAANADPVVGDADAARGKIPIERGDFDDARTFTPSPDGHWIRAPLTTLGADNGIGCAMAMAVSEMKCFRHPPLELLFTVDEEEGMSGALELDAETLNLRGRTLINLDTEDDDELTIGSAGGCDMHIRWEATHTDAAGWVAQDLELKDLRGGHSGIEINSGRANAIRLMAMALNEAADRIPLRVARIDGGDRRNAIPRSCRATVLVRKEDIEALRNALSESSARFDHQFAGRDNPAKITVAGNAAGDKNRGAAFSQADTRRLVGMLLAIPAGVFAMTAEIPDLPETSNNLALIATGEQVIEVDCTARSSYEPGMRDVLATIHSAARLAGAEIQVGNGYPGWKPDLSSKVLATTRGVYERLFEEKPKVLAVHAGLECGVLTHKVQGLDCISFGPTIRDNHAPGERVRIASVDKSFRLLTELLGELAAQ